MRCCCGCPGPACSACTGTPDKALYASTSGITPVASGTCYNASGSAIQTKITYTTSQDPSGCIPQQILSSPCLWGGAADVQMFSPAAVFNSGGVCPSAPSSTGTTTGIQMLISGGVYTLLIYLETPALNHAILFLGTATVSGTPCRLTTPVAFTNTLVAGNIYTTFISGTPAYAVASGGSATVVFKKSCCP
jgi:hypothetical protein